MTDVTDRLYERVLVLRCQAGDESAFAELVGRYQARLGYFLRKALGDDRAAEDALQDVWLSVFRAVPRLADAGAFRAWLYRIARDRASRELRGRRPPPAPLDEADVPDDSAEGAAFAAEDAEQVHRALDELPAEQREALVLRYLEDMSYQEIAAVVGCSVGTVRSRLHYGRRALRGILERANVHD
jgi:RNA polymerase sigma-70 factor (ECF subfamily)